MRRIALIISLAAALCLIWSLPALARSAQKTRSMQSQAARMRTEDPSAVYGWVVVKDPQTGKRWTPDVYPKIIVHFVNRSNGRRESVNFTSGGGTQKDHLEKIWRYYIKFDHNTTFDDTPTSRGSRDTVKYNPLKYRFSHLEVYFRKSEPVRGGTRTIWQIDCVKQSRAFQDLPDKAEPIRP